MEPGLSISQGTANGEAKPLYMQNESHLRAVVDHVLDGLITIDERGIVQSFNPACEHIFGYRADEVIGRNIKILMPEPYHSEHDGYLSNYRETGQAKIIGTPGREVRGKRKDGLTFPMDLSVSAFELEGKRYFSGIIRDITMRKQAEEEIKDNAARLKAVFDTVIDGLIVINSSAVVQSFNAGAERIFGYTAEEVIGENVKMLMPEPYHGEHDGYVGNYLRTGEAKIIGIGREVTALRKDGSTFPMELGVNKFRIRDETAFVGIIRDISERKTFEKKLEAMYQHERRIATTFQEAALPNKMPVIPGISFHSFYGPGKSESFIGGDWYDALRLLDGRVIISIGDVAGSGLQAAVIMANMRQVIRGSGYVNPDPVLMLNAADKMLRAEHPDTIVTAFVGVLDPLERVLTYASAGHPYPILHLQDGTLKELPAGGLMLGLRGRDEPPAETIIIEDGSCLILHTDGLTESTKNFSEGDQRLHDALMNKELYASPDVAKALYDTVLGDGSPPDDVAILTMESESLQTATEESLISRWVFDVHDADAAKDARTAFTQRLRTEGLNEEEVATAEMVFAELIGNVLRYAPGQVEIVADWSSAPPVLHTIDHGSGFSHNPKLPDVFAESGRGLYLISMLTEEFTVLKVSGGGSHACAVLIVRNPNVRSRSKNS
jgi:PAS domain S-box-containing protein